jgi:hypothetical protein
LKAQDEWKKDPEAVGVLEVSCGIPLGDKLNPAKLQNRLDRTSEFEWQEGQLDFLKTLKGLDPDFVDYLKDQQLPNPKVMVQKNDIMVRVEGKMADLPFWEVPISNQMHDLYFNGVIAENNLDGEVLVLEGVRRFQHKADLLRGSTFTFTEDGTRWRYAWDWYELLMTIIMGDTPNIITGTTNPWMGMAHAVEVVAHVDPDFIRMHSPSVADLEDLVAIEVKPIVVSGANAYEMAHLHSHYGTFLNFEWGADLTSDMGPGGIPLPLFFKTE